MWSNYLLTSVTWPIPKERNFVGVAESTVAQDLVPSSF